MYCRICKRRLNSLSDFSTLDCGGDCLRCMAEIGEDPDCIKAMEKINALDTLKRPITTHQEGIDTRQEEGVVGDRQRGAEEDR